MTLKEYLTVQDSIFARAHDISKRKGHDYSGKADTLANLKRTAALGITSAERGVLVRMGDKLSRLVTLIDGEPGQVKDESIQDTILDMVNYSCLLSALLQEKTK